MTRFNEWDYTNNFWETFPEAKLCMIIGKLYIDDESKNKTESSNIMWAIHLTTNPSSIHWGNPDKYNLMAEKVIKDKTFKWEKLNTAISEYEDSILSPAEKYFIQFNEILEGQRKFLRDFKYEKATEKQIQVVQSMTKDLFKVGQEYDKIKKLLREEDTADSGRTVPSFLDGKNK
jgi:hypothetical protein